jgi:hypothetical protein
MMLADIDKDDEAFQGCRSYSWQAAGMHEAAKPYPCAAQLQTRCSMGVASSQAHCSAPPIQQHHQIQVQLHSTCHAVTAHMAQEAPQSLCTACRGPPCISWLSEPPLCSASSQPMPASCCNAATPFAKRKLDGTNGGMQGNMARQRKSTSPAHTECIRLVSLATRHTSTRPAHAAAKLPSSRSTKTAQRCRITCRMTCHEMASPHP